MNQFHYIITFLIRGLDTFTACISKFIKVPFNLSPLHLKVNDPLIFKIIFLMSRRFGLWFPVGGGPRAIALLLREYRATVPPPHRWLRPYSMRGSLHFHSSITRDVLFSQECASASWPIDPGCQRSVATESGKNDQQGQLRLFLIPLSIIGINYLSRLLKQLFNIDIWITQFNYICNPGEYIFIQDKGKLSFNYLSNFIYAQLII